MDDVLELENIGLSPGEARVYLQLLKLGESTKTPIAKAAKISSSKVYEVLDRLAAKSLVSVSVKNNVRHYCAATPDKLLYYFGLKKQEFEKQQNIVESLVPQLKSLMQEKKHPVGTKIFLGTEGLHTALSELIESGQKGDEYCAMGIISRKKPVFNKQWVWWHKLRAKKGMKSRLIFSEREKTDYYRSFEEMPLTRMRRIEMFTPSPIGILGDKVLLTDYTTPLNILIENKSIAKSFQEFFESVWKIAK